MEKITKKQADYILAQCVEESPEEGYVSTYKYKGNPENLCVKLCGNNKVHISMVCNDDLIFTINEADMLRDNLTKILEHIGADNGEE